MSASLTAADSPESSLVAALRPALLNIPQLVRYTVNQPRTVGMQLDYRF
jgi:hypothetical protein